MRIFNRSLILVGLVAIPALGATPTVAQQIRNGGLTGKILSFKTDVPANASSATVFTTPATGFFILTQICAVSFGNPVKLSGLG